MRDNGVLPKIVQEVEDCLLISSFLCFCTQTQPPPYSSVSTAGNMVESQRLRGSRNIRNAALAVLVSIPAILFQYVFLYHCNPTRIQQEERKSFKFWSNICEWGREHPLYLVNAIFFLNVNVLFWIISLIQQSTWLIDPYWTFIPVMIGYFYGTHPHAKGDPLRSRIVMILLWTWSARLTYSYFRRENWQLGEREDWRFTQLRKQHPRHWWWMSFFAVYISQQIFLVGICLPLYAVHFNQTPWNLWDALATFVCGVGITIGFFADNQLHAFMTKNSILKELGVPAFPLLDEGLWRYSRHPNYFGEQLWWWGLALYAWHLGQGWMVVGTLVNSACLAHVTVLVERRMLERPSRADIYRNYQQTTSVLVPWFKLTPKTGAKKPS